MATICALNGPQDFIDDNNKIFTQRRNMVAKHLNDIPGLKCPISQGAFYGPVANRKVS